MNVCTFPTLLLLKMAARPCILVCISALPDSMERLDRFAEHKVRLRNDLALTSSNQHARNIFILFDLLRRSVSLHGLKCLPTGFFFYLKEVLLAGTRPDWTQGVLIFQRKGGISLQK